MTSRNILFAGAAFAALLTSVVSAAEQANVQVSSAETSGQKCARWAGYQNLQGTAQAEYIKDCQLELRVPDKEEGGEGD